MGQDVSKGSFEYRYIPEVDCFRRKVLLIQPPASVASKEEGTTRLLRSVSVQCVTWDAQTILPEQWMTLLGNQLHAVYFVPYRSKTMSDGESVLVLPSAEEVMERATYAFEKVRGASPDAKLSIVVWDNGDEDYETVDEPEEEPAEEEANVSDETAADGHATGDPSTNANNNNDDANTTSDAQQQAAASDDDEYKKPEAEILEDNNRATLAAVTSISKKFGGIKVHTITSAKERFQLGCLLTDSVVPQEITRPLCSLLFQLRDACRATDAFVVDSLTFYPLLSTLDVDPTELNHSLHEALWVFATTVKRIMTTLDSDLHLVSVPCGKNRHLYFGWACRPYAYVMMLAPSVTQRGPTQLMIEKNMEAASMHFYNVINNTCIRRTYTPMAGQ